MPGHVAVPGLAMYSSTGPGHRGAHVCSQRVALARAGGSPLPHRHPPRGSVGCQHWLGTLWAVACTFFYKPSGYRHRHSRGHRPSVHARQVAASPPPRLLLAPARHRPPPSSCSPPTAQPSHPIPPPPLLPHSPRDRDGMLPTPTRILLTFPPCHTPTYSCTHQPLTC